MKAVFDIWLLETHLTKKDYRTVFFSETTPMMKLWKQSAPYFSSVLFQNVWKLPQNKISQKQCCFSLLQSTLFILIQERFQKLFLTIHKCSERLFGHTVFLTKKWCLEKVPVIKKYRYFFEKVPIVCQYIHDELQAGAPEGASQ